MKSIPNKETKIINTDETGKAIGNCLYSDLIRRCLLQPKQGGFDYTDIENRLAISKVMKESSETIELEDAQFKYLKNLIEGMKWSLFHEDILTFKNDIVSIN